MMNKAFFLDRDGVINVEVNYLHEPDKVELIPGVVEALRLIHSRGYLALVVTNQAGVAKGYYPESDVQAVHRRITELLEAAGTGVDGFYYCIHHPDFTGGCDCRKPAPGMLLRAAAEHDVDPAGSVMVGDRLSDIAAGRAAGCRENILVRTGYGAECIRTQDVAGIEVAEDLLDAVTRYFGRQAES